MPAAPIAAAENFGFNANCKEFATQVMQLHMLGWLMLMR